ncbi:substrate-binding periplasmic protein [Salidesulfovibrio onnuriiensis]|uniref:substrate-binding periplasmic protein n=1 Tax=Salidesulfovibrio onnuriiensis TaxID=2583823 RepID=UPI00164F7DCE|nr:transporter substrate-binding domain-containing protein [Salidesulfovibrio onnuriiensis]
MKKLPILAMCALLMLLGLSLAIAQNPKPYRMVCYHIPYLVDDAEYGAFILLFQEAARRAGVTYTMEMLPTKRAMRFFEDGEAMGIVPALRTTLEKDAALTRQIFIKKIVAFVRKGSPILRSIKDLAGKKVGLTRGFSYPGSITKNRRILIDYADTTEGSLKKLADGRLDVVVADGYTAFYAMKELQLNDLDFDLSAVLNMQPVFIAFQPTEEGRELAEKISRAIDSMEADGSMQEILPDMN